MKRGIIQFAVLAAGLLLTGGVTHASFYSGILAQGQNSFDDQNREAFVDVDGDTKLSVGDVLLGFVRLDDHDPLVSGVGPIGNRIYAIFSQEVKTVTVLTIGGNPVFGTIDFQPTTASGLKLSDIVPGAPANGIVAIYSSPTPITDLINNSAGDANSSGTTNLWDYFKVIKDNMTLSAVAGFGTAPSQADDYFKATTSVASGLALLSTGGTATIPGIGQGVTVANFHAGLSILLNNDPTVIYNELVQSTNLSFHELVIKNGNVSGMSGATNSSEWSSILPDAAPTYTGKNPGGFITDADFLVNVTVIPEPSTLTLMGSILSVLGVGYASRRRQVA